ncbi:MAG: PQQ-binding-like beta-propeller repeat protein [Planctomycetaceae bacterium]|nr:PQQ-binding-like beta-propeller repeat protein [Planctomycetaceae bacterium]
MYRQSFFFVAALITVSLTGADWTQFRGSTANSIAEDETQLPLKWTDSENIAWRADLPGRGPSSPIVVDGRVIVTCSSGQKQDRLHVVSFDATSGEKQWERQFWATGRTRSHPSSANAAPTPASDGKHIFAFFSSNDLVCLDLEGNLKWYRGLAYDFPKAGNDVGMASSPAVAGQTVVVQIENQGDSFVSGINTATGETRWRIARPKRANWSSPVTMTDAEGNPLVLLKSDDGLDAHHLETGEKMWSFASSAGGIPSIVTDGSLIYLPADGMTVLQATGGKKEPTVVWTSPRLRPGPASPIIHGDRMFAVNRSGVVTCANLKDGEVEWQLRLKGSFWATPILANGYLYCINDVGSAQVVSLGDKGELVATSEFDDTIQGSPAVADNAMYVRSDKYLWKVSDQ